MNALSPRTALVIPLICLLSASAAAQQAATSAEIEGVGAAVAPPSPSQIDDPWSMLDVKLSQKETGRVVSRSPEGKAPAVLAARSGAPTRSWARTIGALAGVVGLIVLLAWGYRTVASGGLSLANRSRRPGMIEVLSRTMLSPRQSLCLVRVGPRVVLVGQTQERLCALDVIEDAGLAASLSGQAQAGRPDSSSAEFRKALESEAGGYRDKDGERSEKPASKSPPLDHVRREVLDAIERIRRSTARAR